ncbi:hypothetical protein sscle_15g105460 [Sclerotinia sclerotiorum 1980 UF-70]|uniref:Vacuolar calcium ion transporter n=1 Tax=Sclerotinia sclerotiorum (strain ATCC 18683 / 1980 / Ss-1) TaxID=665079 RepID=A0A1D9QLG5_SCLS1|nr:hypothetical protein sscle_15g105460 [Sclerotinia sclerotiorum 1980 UF-70]
MNNVRRQARNARITTERDQPLGLDPLLRCRRWADERLEKPDDERRDVESLPEQNNAHALPSRIEAAHMHSDPEIVMIISAPESLSPIPTIEQIARPQPAGNLDAEKTTSSIVGQKHPRHRFPQSAAEAKPTCELNTAIEHQRSHAPSSVHLVKQIVAIFCSSWLSVLLPFIPAGFASNYTNSPPILNFILNFFAIFPSASIVDMAMDEVMLHFGNTIGVLMYMTFGNIVQLVTSILLLKTRQVEILKTSLVGGILSRVLLIMGASYFAGGINRLQQSFDVSSASHVANFLTLSVASLIIPTASHVFANSTTEKIAAQSRGTSIVLLLVYIVYLFFQLRTHAHVFNPEIIIDTKNVAKQTIKGVAEGTVTESQPSPPSIVFSKNEVLEPRLSMTTGIITLIIGTVVLAFNTTFAVDSIDGLTADHASPTFIGLILLPFLDNDLMPIKCARMDKLDLSIMASAGKSLQTSLLITPLIVIIAWIWGIDDMGLLFDGFQVASLFMAVLIFNFLIATGKSNYLQGVLLLSIYVMIAIAAWYT